MLPPVPGTPQIAPYRVLFREGDWIHRVAIQRVTSTIDDAGGNMTVATTIFPSVPCVVVSGAATETNSNQRQQLETEYTVTMHSNPMVRNNDRLIFGNHLMVVTAFNDEMSLGLIWTIKAKEITS